MEANAELKEVKHLKSMLEQQAIQMAKQRRHFEEQQASQMLAKQEIKLLVGIDEEVQKLQDKLGFIKVMKDDADKRHAKKLDIEKLCLEQLQDKYYKMDDVLDTWSTTRIKAKIEKEEGKLTDITTLTAVKKKVCSFFPSPS
nr:hypothetical protein CFP56_22746 [Quercus suber]